MGVEHTHRFFFIFEPSDSQWTVSPEPCWEFSVDRWSWFLALTRDLTMAWAINPIGSSIPLHPKKKKKIHHWITFSALIVPALHFY